MDFVYLTCWIISALLFLFGTFRKRVEPESLDFVAFGLFFYVLPWIVDRLI